MMSRGFKFNQMLPDLCSCMTLHDETGCFNQMLLELRFVSHCMMKGGRFQSNAIGPMLLYAAI